MKRAVLFLFVSIISVAYGCGGSDNDFTLEAVAGPDQNVKVGETVTLDGSDSYTSSSLTLSFKWSFDSIPDTSKATLSDPNAVKPTFVADIDGEYTLTLEVSDPLDRSNTDFVIITATLDTTNATPVANAGTNQNVTTGDTVTLDGSGTDADGDALTYSWTLAVLPTNSTAGLSDATAQNPTFIADLDGNYVANLIVNDGTIDSVISTVTITATSPPTNAKPVAVAAANSLNVTTGDTITLDGSGSSDADGDSLIYSWNLNSTPANSNAVLSDNTAEKPTFVTDQDGDYVAQLTVNDGTVDSDPDTVTVKATTPPPPPSGTVTHNGVIYNSVTSPQTNQIWLDRNVGATKVCSLLTDTECFGGYYQWGRGTDGHQILSSAKSATLAADVENAGSEFITTTSDWAAASVDTFGTVRSGLWSAIDGSSVCPSGYRVPTISELEAELLVFNNSNELLNSFLKLPTPGARRPTDGTLSSVGPTGFLWTSTPSTYLGAQQGASIVAFSTTYVISYDGYARGYGFGVRCIKD